MNENLCLSSYAFETKIPLSPFRAATVSIEDQKYLYKIIQELIAECESGEGNFHLFDGVDEYDFPKYAAIIPSLIDFDVNNKKFVTALAKEFANFLSRGENVSAFTRVQSECIKLLEEFGFDSGFDIDYESEADYAGFAKLFALRFKNSSTNLMEKLIGYVNILAQITKAKVLIIPFAKQLLNPKEREQFRIHCAYLGIALLFIEPKTAAHKFEWTLIIDKDKCEIVSGNLLPLA